METQFVVVDVEGSERVSSSHFNDHSSFAHSLFSIDVHLLLPTTTTTISSRRPLSLLASRLGSSNPPRPRLPLPSEATHQSHRSSRSRRSRLNPPPRMLLSSRIQHPGPRRLPPHSLGRRIPLGSSTRDLRTRSRSSRPVQAPYPPSNHQSSPHQLPFNLTTPPPNSSSNLIPKNPRPIPPNHGRLSPPFVLLPSSRPPRSARRSSAMGKWSSRLSGV